MEAVEVTLESVFEMSQSLNKAEQWNLVEELLSHLKGSAKGAKKTKKAKDPDAPKRAMTPYMELLNKIVWPILKDISEKTEDPEEKKRMRSVPARTQIASTLWDKMESKEEFASVTKEKVMQVYEDLKINPRAPKTKGAKGSKASTPASSAAPSEDEAEAEKPKAEEKPKKAPAKKAAKATEEDFAEEKKEWTYRNKKYMRLMNYLWDMEDKWVGEWDPATKKINREAAEPEIEYE
jgi:hypothetical protein